MRLSKTAKIMCGALYGLCALCLAVGLSVTCLAYPFEPAGPYAAGLVAGASLSAIKIILMERMLERAADGAVAGGVTDDGVADNGVDTAAIKSKNVKNAGALKVMLRNLLTLGYLLIVFFFRDIFGLFGSIIGILLIQPAAFITGFILRKNSTPV